MTVAFFNHFQEIERLGGKVELAELGEEEKNGKMIPLPPVLLGQLGEDPKKKTVLIYGHLDVQPALKVRYGC